MSAPRWAEALLGRLAPPDQVETLLGDLEETHARRVSRRGRILAWLLTSLETLDMAIALRRERAQQHSQTNVLLPVRGRRGLPFSWLDFKLGARMLARYPGLSLIAGLALAFAIAIGALTFEIVTQIARPSLPLSEGDRIVTLRLWDAVANDLELRASHDFGTWRDELESIEDLGAFRSLNRNLTTATGHSEPVIVAETSASAFRLVRVPVQLGRALVDADERSGAPPVAVVGHDVWQGHFEGDPDVVGQTVRLGTTATTVVGVMPEGFGFPIAHNVWVPLPADVSTVGPLEGQAIRTFARLARGVTLDDAQAELAALGSRAARDFPATHEHLRPQILPYAQGLNNLPEFVSLLLYSTNLGAVMFLVLVCANVALLVFARTAAREDEIAMRSALGASRGRIAMQLFAEALVLGIAAAAVGLATASVGLQWAAALIESQLLTLPFWVHTSLSLDTLVYAGTLTLLVAVIAGVGPALKVTRGLQGRLKETGIGGSDLRFGGIWTGVIVTQVALTVFCLPIVYDVGADMGKIRTADLGYPADEYLAARLDMDPETATGALAEGDQEALFARFESSATELTRRLEADPSVVAVTLADQVPGVYHQRRRIEVEGPSTVPRTPQGHRPQTGSVDPGYFDAFGVRVVAGRGFDSGDRLPGRHVAIVNEAFVSEVLGDGSAVGRRFRFRIPSDPDRAVPANGVSEPWFEIVGVVEDLALTVDPDLRERAGLYLPLTVDTPVLQMAVHVRDDPAALARRLGTLAASVDPTLMLSELRPLSDVVTSLLGFYGFWFRVALLTFAVVLVLSLSGIYAVVSFTVARRTREVGLRMALGASRRHVVTAIFTRAFAQVGTGIVVGSGLIVTVLLVTREQTGPLPLWQVGMVVGFAMLMLTVCLLACTVPVRRALKIEPTEALRTDG